MTELLAISSMEHAELAEFIDGMSAHVGVPIRLARWSTAELGERLRSARAGDWDLLLGTAVTTLLDPDAAAHLLPLDQIDCAALPPSAVADDRRWFSPSGFVPAFCYDVEQLAERGLTPPPAWRALAAPGWSGRIALPDPARSGAGYLHLSALLEHDGDAAWSLLADIARQRPSISGSSTAPIDDVLAGRAWIGVTVSTAATRAVHLHPSLRWLIPDDARRYEYEAFGCRAGSAHADLAQRALGWMLSAQAAAISRRYGKVAFGAGNGDAFADAGASPEQSGSSGLKSEPKLDLSALNVLEAGRSKTARTARWHSLFSMNDSPQAI